MVLMSPYQMWYNCVTLPNVVWYNCGMYNCVTLPNNTKLFAPMLISKYINGNEKVAKD